MLGDENKNHCPSCLEKKMDGDKISSINIKWTKKKRSWCQELSSVQMHRICWLWNHDCGCQNGHLDSSKGKSLVDLQKIIFEILLEWPEIFMNQYDSITDALKRQQQRIKNMGDLGWPII